jgi:DNA-directed RNA polymerase subunit RPC12/RpoP
MDLFDDFLAYEVCFPGGVTGETELDCPYCGELLTVPVNDPMGEEVYQCGECAGTFEVNWGEGQVRYQAEE